MNPIIDNAFPVLNIPISQVLHIEPDAKSKISKYKSYRALIKRFYANYLDTEEFKKMIPLHETGFLKVAPHLIGNIPDESNLLKFQQPATGKFPKKDFLNRKPFEKISDNVHLFFIYHKDDQNTKDKFLYYLEKGLGHYNGLTAYAGILFHPDSKMDICFEDRENPLPEVQQFFDNEFVSTPNVKYLAIYLTPFSKEETRKQEIKFYARIKQILLKRKIACQSVEPATVETPNNNFKWSLTTMSVSILAKLGGIPWRLNTPKKEELIVGVGTFRHPDEVRYVSSATSFNNTGHFNEFEYFMAHETDILAGQIAAKVTQFAKTFGVPQRLIIHFYKKLSEDELAPD